MNTNQNVIQSSIRRASDRIGGRYTRIGRDAAVAFLAFALVAATINSSDTPAPPPRAADVLVESIDTAGLSQGTDTAGAMAAAVRAMIPVPGNASASVATAPDRGLAIIMLAAVFSAAIAFNLAFLRHLGRVYASPRRAGGGRS